MLVCIPNVLDAAQLVSLRERLERSNSWVDGRVTAGYQGAPVKFNQQIDERSQVALECQRIIGPALERNPLFISAVLPNVIYPLMFNRYGEGMTFGAHVDGSVRISPHDGRKIRTDISATLFLTNPEDYDGGELQIEDTYGRHCIKLAAGDMVVYPLMFNRYGEGMTFGAHVDGSVRIHPHNGTKLRTDISATLFLSDPASYDGGELQIEDTYGMHSVKLNAGDLVIYPATSLHQVTPITRGVRVASFFWIQSLIRDDAQRAMLFDLDNAIQTLNQTGADATARRTLIGVYHNLMRQWSET